MHLPRFLKQKRIDRLHPHPFHEGMYIPMIAGQVRLQLGMKASITEMVIDYCNTNQDYGAADT